MIALEPIPARERPQRRRPELTLVKSPVRAAKKLRLRKIVVFVAVVVLMSMVVVARIAIELQESTIGQLQSEIAQAQRTQDNLKLQVAELSSPSRIMAYASAHLHLTLPGSVDVVAGSATKHSVALPQAEGSTPTLPLPAGEVASGG
jgi:cell division protein FtsL